MKKIKCLSILLVFAITPLQADDLTTRDGKVYHDYKVLGHDAGYLTILYSDGGGKIPLSNLSDDMQKKYGYDKATADAFVQASTQADRQAREAIAAERKQAAEKKAAATAAAAANTTPAVTGVATPVAPTTTPATASPAPAKPDALSKDEIAAIKAKIRDLQDDVDFMTREEAKLHPLSPGTSSSVSFGGGSNGGYPDKIREENDQIADLQAQLTAGIAH